MITAVDEKRSLKSSLSSVLSSGETTATLSAWSCRPAFPPLGTKFCALDDREWLDWQNRNLEYATAEEILTWAVERYFPRFTLATALGPESCVIISMLAKIEPRVYVFNIDTGYQFPQTLELCQRLQDKYGIAIHFQRPELSVAEYEAVHGGPLYLVNPDQCCYDRKVAVLHRIAQDFDAWASGIRREQSPYRANTPIVRWDEKFGLVKVSPLATWTKEDVWRRIFQEKIPYNPLHDRGYPSIGCWPCTRAVGEGEAERAGRWSHTAKTECGLHA
jgi:phosphoadenosine phosphosulfate reductase